MMRCSICMSTRNKANILRQVLFSIRTQKVPFPYELIVADDGSTDHTFEVCEEFGAEYHYVENSRYRNPSVARNVAYRAAQGDVIIAQSDDVIHVSRNAIESLVINLKECEFLLAHVTDFEYVNGCPAKFIMEYCGLQRQVPYFFLGSLWRRDLYAIGGCDEEFTEPCYDDNWFADCLIHELGLKARHLMEVKAHHVHHGYESNSHVTEEKSRQLYQRKREQARKTGRFLNSGGPWKFERSEIRKARCRLPSPSIPRHMNFFWVGRLSWMRYMTLSSFRHHNPDWDVTLWTAPNSVGPARWTTGEQQDIDTYHGKDYTSRVDELGIELKTWNAPHADMSPPQACDLFEWELLSTTGGFYADMDILFVRSMPNDLLDGSDVVYCLDGSGFMTIGFFGASPHNCFFEAINRSANSEYHPDRYQGHGAESVYKLTSAWPHWGRVWRPGQQAMVELSAAHPCMAITPLHSDTFYPWEWNQVREIFCESHAAPEQCIGIHWFGGSSISKRWNVLLTEENYGRYDNTFTRHVPR